MQRYPVIVELSQAGFPVTLISPDLKIIHEFKEPVPDLLADFESILQNSIDSKLNHHELLPPPADFNKIYKLAGDKKKVVIATIKIKSGCSSKVLLWFGIINSLVTASINGIMSIISFELEGSGDIISYLGTTINMLTIVMMFFASGAPKTLKNIGFDIDNLINPKMSSSPDILEPSRVKFSKIKCRNYTIYIGGYLLLIINTAITANFFFQNITSLGKEAEQSTKFHSDFFNETNINIIGYITATSIFLSGTIFQGTLFKNLLNRFITGLKKDHVESQRRSSLSLLNTNEESINSSQETLDKEIFPITSSTLQIQNRRFSNTLNESLLDKSEISVGKEEKRFNILKSFSKGKKWFEPTWRKEMLTYSIIIKLNHHKRPELIILPDLKVKCEIKKPRATLIRDFEKNLQIYVDEQLKQKTKLLAPSDAKRIRQLADKQSFILTVDIEAKAPDKCCAHALPLLGITNALTYAAINGLINIIALQLTTGEGTSGKVISYTGAILNLIMYLVVYYAAGSIDTLKKIGNGIDNINTNIIQSADVVLTGKKKFLKYSFNIVGYGLLVINNFIGANSFFQSILALSKKANNNLMNENNMYTVAWTGAITIFTAGTLFQNTLFKNISNNIFNYFTQSNDRLLLNSEDDRLTSDIVEKLDLSTFKQLDDIEFNVNDEVFSSRSSASELEEKKDSKLVTSSFNFNPRFTFNPGDSPQTTVPPSVPEQGTDNTNDSKFIVPYSPRITSNMSNRKEKEEQKILLPPPSKSWCLIL